MKSEVIIDEIIQQLRAELDITDVLASLTDKFEREFAVATSQLRVCAIKVNIAKVAMENMLNMVSSNEICVPKESGAPGLTKRPSATVSSAAAGVAASARSATPAPSKPLASIVGVESIKPDMNAGGFTSIFVGVIPMAVTDDQLQVMLGPDGITERRSLGMRKFLY